MSNHNAQGQRNHEVVVRAAKQGCYAVLYECDVYTAEGPTRATCAEAIDALRVVIEAEHAGRLREIARALNTQQAQEIAEAVSAKLKRDAYWDEVDAYYRDRARR